MNRALPNTLKYAFLLFIAVASSISFIVYIVTNNFIRQDYFKTIQIRTDLIAKLDQENKDGNEALALIEVKNGLSEKLENETDYKIRLKNNLNTDSLEKDLSIPPGFITTLILNKENQLYSKNKFYYAQLNTLKTGEEYIYLTIAEHHISEKVQNNMRKISFLGTISIALFSIFIFIYLSKRIFSPITKITERVRQISAENLHLRLYAPKNSKELSELTTTFNDMINRLETTFETQNNFISNASHELRTPLTAIMGVSEVCLSKTRTPEEYVETIKIIMEEADKLESKTKALLMLAQTGFNGKTQKFEVMRIDELLWEVKATIDTLNNENNVIFDLDLLPDNPYKLKINGNAQLLHLAFTNILLNACKYSDNDFVTISVGVSEHSVIIVIKDKGIGIPVNEIEYIFDPFFRASNTVHYKGYGIGLPLARNIIIMHKGQLDVQSVNQEGVTVHVRLPLVYV